jgi:signal transduction histidine kinase
MTEFCSPPLNAYTLSTRLRIVEQRIGIRTKLEINGQDHISQKIRREIFYIATEALNNAIKHSHAKQILVIIEATDRKTELLIKDNGRGFTTKPLDEKGMGLENMYHRAKKIGGTLQITSSPREGTGVQLSVEL